MEDNEDLQFNINLDREPTRTSDDGLKTNAKAKPKTKKDKK